MDGIKRAEIDKIYRNMNLENIPWNIEAPPGALIELVTLTLWIRREYIQSNGSIQIPYLLRNF